MKIWWSLMDYQTIVKLHIIWMIINLNVEQHIYKKKSFLKFFCIQSIEVVKVTDPFSKNGVRVSFLGVFETMEIWRWSRVAWVVTLNRAWPENFSRSNCYVKKKNSVRPFNDSMWHRCDNLLPFHEKFRWPELFCAEYLSKLVAQIIFWSMQDNRKKHPIILFCAEYYYIFLLKKIYCIAIFIQKKNIYFVGAPVINILLFWR
jgi:hypothetical protein